eukprot:jgi/Ulvmu1/2538/UM139_0006.1
MSACTRRVGGTGGGGGGGGVDADHMLLVFGGVICIFALVLALALALGCVIGLCTARTLPPPRDRNAGRQERQMVDDARATAVVPVGDTAEQRRHRRAAPTGQETGMLPQRLSEVDNDSK